MSERCEHGARLDHGCDEKHPRKMIETLEQIVEDITWWQCEQYTGTVIEELERIIEELKE